MDDIPVRLIATLAFLACIVSLGACEQIDQRYGPRHVSAPPPLSLPERGYATAPIDTSGAVIVSGGTARPALTRPEFYPARRRLGPVSEISVPTVAEGEGVSLNFVQAGIDEVVDVVLGQLLGVNYIIDPRVQGTVTTRTSRPIAPENLLPVLENILAANGAAIVQSGNLVNIVPIDVARTLPHVVVAPGRSVQPRGFGTYFIPLEHASVVSVQETIVTQISPGSQLVADPARNLLVFTGPEQEARSVEEMANVLDIDLLTGRSFALLPLRTAAPTQIAAELERMIGGGGEPALGGADVLPIERMGAVLVIGTGPAQLRQLADWVARLDRADVGAERQVLVYHVRNGLASGFAEVLNQVFAVSAAAAPPAEVAPGLETGEIGADSFAALDAAAPAAEVRIVADDARNAIVVSGSPEQIAEIGAALRQLDTQPIQVLIEATIAEVLLTDQLEYGLRWAFESGDFSTALFDSRAAFVGPRFPGLNLVLDSADALVVLRALSEVTDVEVISSPQLMVLDNETARLQVGDRVPVTTQQVVSVTDADAPVVNSVAYFDTGVILEVTPRVNAEGMVTLQVVQEVSDAVRTESSDIDSPTIQQRRVESIIAVPNGQTVALGGLIRDRQEAGEGGVPVAKDIPVVGNLFKSRSRRGQRTELLILITPRVMLDANQSRALTTELRNRLPRLRQILPTEL